MIRDIRLSQGEREILAAAVREAFTAWATSCPTNGVIVRLILSQTRHEFSRFIEMLDRTVGPDYRPDGTRDGLNRFPLTGRETAALASALELSTADRTEIEASAILAAFCPLAQPAHGTRQWRAFKATLDHIGLDCAEEQIYWRSAVMARLGHLCEAVAAELVAHAGSAAHV
jgi:hypothetical protein